MNEQENKNLRKLLDEVFATEVNELQCDQAGILMALSTHDGLTDAESQRQYPLLWQHFQFCPDCAEEYRMLATLTELEQTGQLQRPPQIPPVPGTSKPSISKKIKEVLTKQFPGFQPAVELAVQRGSGSLEMEPAEITLDQDYTIQLDLTADEENRNYRYLYGTILIEDKAIFATIEGSSAWLQLTDGGVVHEEAIDELGDFAFSHIQPGNYLIRLYLSGREYIVTDIIVP